jgi:hypothetical protein
MSTQVEPSRRIRKWADWEAALRSKNCTKAEEKLVKACREGKRCSLGDGKRPTVPTEENVIGADLLRYLIKGGCNDCDLHDWDIDLFGAFVKGELDLGLVKAFGITELINCHFEASIRILNSNLFTLNLSGSSCTGLRGDGVRVKADVVLADGFAAKGRVSLAGAVIGGQLVCDGGSFENTEGDALNAHDLEVKGGVFFADGFAAKGGVNLSGAVIGGQFDCGEGSFENAEGYALNALGIKIKGDAIFNNAFAAKGEVDLGGAVIGGQLDCGGGSFENAGGYALDAQGARVNAGAYLIDGFTANGEVNLASAVIGGRLICDGGNFENAKGNALNAQGVSVKASVVLGNGFAAKGGVSFAGAVIGGQLVCNAGSFQNAGNIALFADSVEAKGGIFLADGFAAKGEVSLSGAVIGGQFICRGGSFESADEYALYAGGASVKGDILFDNGFVAKGEVSLSGAVVDGQLVCNGGVFENAKGNALNAQGVSVKASVVLGSGFAAKGGVNLSGAVIGGQFVCRGGSFENAGNTALFADRVEAKNGIFLADGFAAKGGVNLSGAVIGGQFVCRGGSFENAAGHALNAEGASVKGDIFFDNGFVAKGEVSLSGAVVDGQLVCNGGIFENAKGDALNAQDIAVGAGIFLDDGFAAKGEVNVASAVISGLLSFSGGSIENTEGHALDAQSAKIDTVRLAKVKSLVGSINFASAKVHTLIDDAPSLAMLHLAYLDGFEYQTIRGPIETRVRLDWLEKARAFDSGFSPQPYEQLAWVLKRMGHNEQRRIVLVEKEKRLRSSERDMLRLKRRFGRLLSTASKKQDDASRQELNQHIDEQKQAEKEFNIDLLEQFVLLHDSWPQKARSNGVNQLEIARAQTGFRHEIFWQNGRTRMRIAWLLIKDHLAKHLVGYGYHPFKFVGGLALLIIIGWVVAYQAYDKGDFVPNSDVILSTADWQALAEGGSANPAREWAAVTGKGRDYETFSSFAYAVDIVIPIVSIGQEAAWAPSTTRGPWGTALWWLRWLLTVLGWIVTAVGAAAITGIIRRD